MSLRKHIGGYLLSVVYGAAIVFIPVHGPRQFAAALLQLAAGASLLMLFLLLVAYRDEIRELIGGVLRACAYALLCLLPGMEPDWRPVTGSVSAFDPVLLSILFQRPPPAWPSHLKS
jgi:hypothetical protein